MAAEKGHAAVVQLLLDKGADFTIRDTEVLVILFIDIHTYIHTYCFSEYCFLNLRVCMYAVLVWKDRATYGCGRRT